MPHDKNGVVLQVGDEVIFRAKVESITPNETFCNCTVKATREKSEVDDNYEECLTCNSKFFEKV